MINEEAFEKIKNVIITIDDKEYIKVKKNTFKRLGYHYNIFTKVWKRTKFDGVVSSIKFKVIKHNKNTYLVWMDLDDLNNPLVDMFITPYVVELIDDEVEKCQKD